MGVIFSNELLDAMPVHRLQWRGGQWHELWVVRDRDGFGFQPGPLSNERLREDVEELDAIEGQIVEVNRAAEAWIRDAAATLKSGFVLTFDYGDLRPAIWGGDRVGGTLRCFANHGLSHDPFRAVGRQDITTSVDFTAIERTGRDAGLATAGFTTQASFLARWGVDAILDVLTRADFESDAVLADRQALAWLTRPDGLGGVRVLAQARNVAPTHLTGFDGPGDAPRLTTEHWPRLPVHDPFAPLR